MKKKVPVVRVAERAEAARVAQVPFEATVTLDDVAAAIKEGLLALSCTADLLVMERMMQEELTATVGPKGRHNPDRQAVRNGSTKGSVVLGGRTVPVRRPRAVGTWGGEVALDTYALFSSSDLLAQLTVERMLAGVATRRHAAVAQPVGETIESKARSTSRSSVSRRFKQATETALAELLARDLSSLDVAALMMDGIVSAECCCVAALVVTTDGTKVPVGLWDGDTENKIVVTDLLVDLVARGLAFEQGLLVVIDGAKALASGVARVFGRHALVQRCVLHKRRNVASYLTDDLALTTDRRLAQAFGDTDPARGAPDGRRHRPPARGEPSLRRRKPARGARRDVHRPPPGDPRSPCQIAFVHHPDRVHDLGGPGPDRPSHALAGRPDGAPLGRHRDARGRAQLPACEGGARTCRCSSPP